MTKTTEDVVLWRYAEGGTFGLTREPEREKSMASATLGTPYVVSAEGAAMLADMAEARPAARMEGFVSRRASNERLAALNERVSRDTSDGR